MVTGAKNPRKSKKLFTIESTLVYEGLSVICKCVKHDVPLHSKALLSKQV